MLADLHIEPKAGRNFAIRPPFGGEWEFALCAAGSGLFLTHAAASYMLSGESPRDQNIFMKPLFNLQALVYDFRYGIE